MSEKKYSKNSSVAPLIATIAVAIVAIILAAVAIMTMNSGSEPTSQPSSTTSQSFQPDSAFVEACTYAAHDLVRDNYKILRLFVTEGLPHLDEPYGNEPEDGLYTVNSTEYNSLAQIRELVNAAYVSEEAERILTNIDLNGLAVYQERSVLTDIVYSTEATTESEEQNRPLYKQETVLGISADFKPIEYNKDWTECSIAVMPISEDECRLTIYLGGADPDNAEEADPESVLEAVMVNSGGAWKLTALVY